MYICTKHLDSSSFYLRYSYINLWDYKYAALHGLHGLGGMMGFWPPCRLFAGANPGGPGQTGTSGWHIAAGIIGSNQNEVRLRGGVVCYVSSFLI